MSGKLRMEILGWRTRSVYANSFARGHVATREMPCGDDEGSHRVSSGSSGAFAAVNLRRWPATQTVWDEFWKRICGA